MVENADNIVSALTPDDIYASLETSLQKPYEGDNFTPAIKTNEARDVYNVGGVTNLKERSGSVTVMHFVLCKR